MKWFIVVGVAGALLSGGAAYVAVHRGPHPAADGVPAARLRDAPSLDLRDRYEATPGALRASSRGGTADLPPESVFVMAQSAAGKEVPFSKGPLEMTGILEVGNAADEQGRVSAFRLRLDPPSNQTLAKRD